MSPRRHPQLSRALATYKGLPGEYGYLEVKPQSARSVRYQLTSEYVDLSRADAQQMIRALSAWLAAPTILDAEFEEEGTER